MGQGEQLVAAHEALQAAFEELVTGEDWQRFLGSARAFHRYSPANQLLLAAQGARGLVASYRQWQKVPAVGGGTCRVRKGEKALRVYAPLRSTARVRDAESGEERSVEVGVRGYRLVPVFSAAQLVAPPDLAPPPLPERLVGPGAPAAVWDAVVAQLAAAGYAVVRGVPAAHPEANGETDFARRLVTVRDDVEPAQALKTAIHELGHALMHHPDNPQRPADPGIVEVEAESVAYVVCDSLGIDSAAYTLPYLAGWARGDRELVRQTAERVLRAAQGIVERLGDQLGAELAPDVLGRAIAGHEAEARGQAAEREPPAGPVSEPEPARAFVWSPRERLAVVGELLAVAADPRGAAAVLTAVSTDAGDALQLAVAARQRAGVLTQLAHHYGLSAADAAAHMRRVGVRLDDAMAVLVRLAPDPAEALAVVASTWSGHSRDELARLAARVAPGPAPGPTPVPAKSLGAELIGKWSGPSAGGGGVRGRAPAPAGLVERWLPEPPPVPPAGAGEP